MPFEDEGYLAPALWAHVAHALAGKPVRVRYRPPSLVGSAGDYFRAKDDAGRIVDIINIHPDHKGDLSVFLHEVAHAKLHETPVLHDFPPGVFELPEGDYLRLVEANSVDPQEIEADSQANAWQQAVEAALPPGATIEQRLSWLLDSAMDGEL